MEMTAVENKGTPGWLKLTELSSLTHGSTIAFSTDEFFSDAPKMLQAHEAVWKEDEYTEFGKWMDGWESRRKRIPGHDWSIVKLGLAGYIEGVSIDTAFFTGNQAPRFSLQGINLNCEKTKMTIETLLMKRSERDSWMGQACNSADLALAETINSHKWQTIIPMTPLRPGYKGYEQINYNILSLKVILQLIITSL
jgi:allantoicase